MSTSRTSVKVRSLPARRIEFVGCTRSHGMVKPHIHRFRPAIDKAEPRSSCHPRTLRYIISQVSRLLDIWRRWRIFDPEHFSKSRDIWKEMVSRAVRSSINGRTILTTTISLVHDFINFMVFSNKQRRVMLGSRCNCPCQGRGQGLIIGARIQLIPFLRL